MRGIAALALVGAAAGLAGVAGAWPWKAGRPEPIPPRPLPTPSEVAAKEWPAAVRALCAGARRLNGLDHGPLQPTAIVLHSTSGLDLPRALMEMERRGMGVHVVVEADGTAHLLVDTVRRVRAAAGIDDVAIHVSVVGGIGEELAAQTASVDSVAKILSALADAFAIPKTNHDVASRRGVFSHMQVKYRYGGWLRTEKKDRMEPGEEFVRAVLAKAGGAFYEEKDWKDRGGPGWVQVWERSGTADRGELTKGRGLTPAPKPGLKSVEVVEERRMQYVDRGKIEILGVVLHFTATETYDQALVAFENRRLGPTIMVDTEGSAFQVVDSLDEMVAAAAGTNEKCVQIEIVGRGENDLLFNPAQMRKVIEIVGELCEKYSIPKTNRDIESRRGIFSHGQAKKRWGRSAWLWGGNIGDFDPGERFMKRVIEGVGGTYATEPDWDGRRSGAWIILADEWLP